jgi:hypothetical protein
MLSWTGVIHLEWPTNIIIVEIALDHGTFDLESDI